MLNGLPRERVRYLTRQFTMKSIIFFLIFASISVLTAHAQTPPKPAPQPQADALKLTDAERKALEPLQSAAIEANQELVNAADALDAAKPADVLAAAWRWKAAATAFKSALRERGNWISATAKAKNCDGCELNLQTGEFQKAKTK